MGYYWDHFHRLEDEPLTFLEIGVFRGQSMRMWEILFPKATLHTLDVNPECTQFANPPRSTVTLGLQGDPAVLEQWVASIAAPIDIIVDDGSHQMHDLKTSFASPVSEIAARAAYMSWKIWAPATCRTMEANCGIPAP